MNRLKELLNNYTIPFLKLFKPIVVEHTSVFLKEKIAEKKAEIARKQNIPVSKEQER